MNINTFFLDKLLAVEQSVSVGSKKVSSSTNLFSDIIKVFEQEGGQNPQPNESTGNSNLNSQNDLQLPVNIIEFNSSKLQALSQFIDSFMADPQLAVKATEVKHDLQSVVINKKQFLLSSDNLENFIQGLIQNLGLNNSTDLQTVISQNLKTENEADIPVNINAVANADVSDTQSSEKNSDGKVKSDETLTDNGAIAQSLLQYLSDNKTLSLSVKNGKDKININVYTLPEKNIETELNLEKLSADFNKTNKEFNAPFANILKEQAREKTLSAAASKGLEKNPADFNSSPIVQNYSSGAPVINENASQTESANPVDSIKPADTLTPVKQTDAANPVDLTKSADALKPAKQTDATKTVEPSENVYKTEVVEITFNPAVQSKNLDSSGSKSKIFQMPVFEQSVSTKNLGIYNSSSAKKGFELFDAGFRVKNNFTAQLNALQNSNNSSGSTTTTAKSAAPNANPILVQQSAQVLKVVEAGNNKIVNQDTQNAVQPAINNSSEKSDVIKEIKAMLGNLNGTLESAGSTKSSIQKDKIFISGQSSEMKNGVPGTKIDYAAKIQEAKQNISVGQKDQKQAETISGIKIEPSSKNQEAKQNISAAPKLQKQTDITAEMKPANGENIISTEETPKAKAFTQEAKDVLMSGMVSQKATAIDEKVKTDKDSGVIKSVSNENVKSDKIEVKETAGKESGDKEFAQNKSTENFKNVMQSTEQPKSIDADRLKIMADAKQIIDQPKVIKQNEIIPEFTKVLQAGEKQSMTFQLTPENLGKVKLVVDLVNNHVSTRIEVENDQVKQFIQSNIEQLKQNLQSSGVHLSNVNISLAESDQKFAKTFTSKRKMGEKISKIKEGDDTTHRSQKSLGYNTYEYLA